MEAIEVSPGIQGWPVVCVRVLIISEQTVEMLQ